MLCYNFLYMKKIIWIVIIVIIAAAAYMAFKPKATAPVKNVVEARGEIISINTEGVALDGPALVNITTEDGEAVVAVPSMGINLCAAKDSIADVYELRAGDMVSVRGEKNENGHIVPCVDASHYLRLESTE